MTPDGFRIRPARAEEAEALAAVEADAGLALREAGFTAYGLGGISAERLGICAAEGLLWAAVEGSERPVGFAAATVADGNLHVLELSVDRACQRLGLGRALMERVIDHGRWAFFPAVTLTTDADVPFNAPFYRTLGFVALETGRLPPDLATMLAGERDALGPTVRRIAMAKVL
jgi:GNAT superfamily N-acetyltransferase